MQVIGPSFCRARSAGRSISPACRRRGGSAEAQRLLDAGERPPVRPRRGRPGPGAPRAPRRRRSTSCSSTCTTSSPTAGRSASSCASWRALPAPSRPAALAAAGAAVQYADFAVWQRQRLAAPIGWRSSSPTGGSAWPARRAVLDLPTDRPRPAVQRFRGATRALALPGRRAAPALHALGRGSTGRRCSWRSWRPSQTLLARSTGQDDCVVGTPVAGPQPARDRGLIGFFVNTLVLRADLAGDPAFRELLGRVREAALGAYAPPGPAVRAAGRRSCSPSASLAAPPLFQVDARAAERAAGRLGAAGPGLETSSRRSTAREVRPDLRPGRAPDGVWPATCEYNTDLFDAATVDRLLGHFGSCWTAAVADPRRGCSRAAAPGRAGTPSAARWIGTGRRRRRRRGAACTSCSRRQASAAPDAAAVGATAASLTYARAERGAPAGWPSTCVRLGVGPEVPVGVSLERSPDAGGRPPRRAQGRRRLRAARSAAPARAAGSDAGGRRRRRSW